MKKTLGGGIILIEDAFWKKGGVIGVFDKIPLNVQDFVGNDIVRSQRPRSIHITGLYNNGDIS
jgi:hypothetical protein